MYLGIDFLISPEQQPYVVEVNVGLPGGAQEYHLTHLVHFGKPSDIFNRIEETSERVYGMAFRNYLHSLPHIRSLKPFKIWMDGKGPFPDAFHPGLRLEDKWIQYQLIKPIAPVPETVAFTLRICQRQRSSSGNGKRGPQTAFGRGGRNFKILYDPQALSSIDTEGHACLLQQYIESRVNGYTFSIRSVAFAGEFICMYANLSTRSYSNHGFLTFVSEGESFGLSEREFKTEFFSQKSWEAEIWFGKETPAYLKHNLYEDEVARTTLHLPEPILRTIKELSVKIERVYEGLDFASLPRACFESPHPSLSSESRERGIRISSVGLCFL